jgi:hypothetical protein
MSNIPTTWRRWASAANHGAISFFGKGQPSTRKTPHRYMKYSPAAEKRKGRATNRRMACGLQLIVIMCLSVASIDHSHAFDSDLVPIVIDNCSSRSLTNSRKDFKPGTIQPCNISVAGIAGAVGCKLMGTVSWTIEDDQGGSQNFEVANTPLCTSLPHRLFSPQQWAQQIEGKSRMRIFGGNCPSCTTNAQATTLTWGNGKFSKTVPLSKTRNVAVMSTKPGIKKFTAFAAEVKPLEPQPTCFVPEGTPQCCFINTPASAANTPPAEVTDNCTNGLRDPS